MSHLPTAEPQAPSPPTAWRGEPAELSARFRDLLSTPAFARPAHPTLAEHRELTLQWCQALAGQGLGRLGLPADMGGDANAFFLLCENLALFDASLMVKFGVHAGLIQSTIARLGTERHRVWLERTPTFERIGCFAMTETAHGSDVRSLETTARYLAETGEFEIVTPHRAARKDYIGSAALHGHFAVVFAQLEVAGRGHGVHAFLVSLRDDNGQLLPGIELEDCGAKAGLNGVDNGRLGFASVRVPQSNLLDRFGGIDEKGEYRTSIKDDGARFFTMLANLLAGRLMVCAATWSGARSSLAIAVRYALRRRQFGASPGSLLLDYQAHQKRLIPRLSQAYAVTAAISKVRAEYLPTLSGDQPAGRALETRIAALKAYCSWSALETVQVCRECCGGAGYLADNRLGLIRADLDVFTTFEGDNTVLGLLVARNLLAELKDQGAVSAAGRLLQARWSKARTILRRSTSQGSLRSSGFHKAAFQARRERLTSSLAQRIGQRMKEGQSASDAFNACQDHALSLASAYAIECVYDAFAQEVRARGSFKPLRDLFALWTLENEAAFYLEKDLLSGSQMKTIRSQVLELSAELRDYAEELVNYFDISDRLLGAPGLLDP